VGVPEKRHVDSRCGVSECLLGCSALLVAARLQSKGGVSALGHTLFFEGKLPRGKSNCCAHQCLQCARIWSNPSLSPLGPHLRVVCIPSAFLMLDSAVILRSTAAANNANDSHVVKRFALCYLGRKWGGDALCSPFPSHRRLPASPTRSSLDGCCRRQRETMWLCGVDRCIAGQCSLMRDVLVDACSVSFIKAMRWLRAHAPSKRTHTLTLLHTRNSTTHSPVLCPVHFCSHPELAQ
jgi:hypothetical protein